ncbi:MAG: tRNA (adenine-N1)-methyltransferase, partial [Actinobacteria bacterium]|nr:tRNA (adenine-N1)-methyltransferase [Actinomycetota bacterium]
VRQTLDAVRGEWVAMRTLEVLHRTWHIEGESVRPDHRMVAHTGFLTVARLLTAR